LGKWESRILISEGSKRTDVSNLFVIEHYLPHEGLDY
jgi:hypothetical protein